MSSVRRSGKQRGASAATRIAAQQNAIVVAPSTAITQMSKKELSAELVKKRVRQSSLTRRHYGAATEMPTIASAILNAELGYLTDFMDLQTETLTLDPHLASCAVKRFAPLACADWDMTPAQAAEKKDRKWAIEIADVVRDSFVRAQGLQDAIYDTAWAIQDNRAASEVNWGTVDRYFLPRGFDWVHARDLTYGAFRELRIVDPFLGGGFRSDIGIDVEEIPGKFVHWKPRMFREHHEREGLGFRSVYWAFFKRFSNRNRMKLTEAYAIGLRVIEIDNESMANPESINRIREEVEDLSSETTALLDRGVGLNVIWPETGSHEIFKLTLEDVNAEISKLYLGNRSTTDPDANRSNSIIGKNEQEMLFALDAARISARFQELVRVAVEVNWPGAAHLVPKFQIRAAQQRDRDKELARARVFLGMGMTIAVDEIREIAGFRAPIDDEPFLRLGASGGVDAMGAALPGTIEIVDPTKPDPSLGAGGAPPPGAGDAPAPGADDSQEEKGKDGQEENAQTAVVKDILGLERRAVCCSGHEQLAVGPNGSPETLIVRGVREGVRATSKWARQIAEACDGADTAVRIRARLKSVEAALDVEPFARAVERRMVWGAMLGALDAGWEAENDSVVKPAAFLELGDGTMPILLADGGVANFVTSPFAEAIRIFNQKKIVSRKAFDRLSGRAKEKAFTIGKGASKDMIAVAKDELSKALVDGDDLRLFSARLDERFESAGFVKLNPSHVETIFRNNTMGAYASGRHEQMTQPAVLAARPYWQIKGPNDQRKRPAHKAALDKVVRADDPAWKRGLRPPWGHNCFLPETRVAGRFIGASRALYEGKFVQLTTKEGRRLTVTAQHPVLAAQGFTSAETIRVGDELVCYAIEKDRARARGAQHNDHEREAMAQEVFDALSRTPHRGATTAARDDFHGEAKRFVGEVEVVGSYGMLPHERQAARAARTLKRAFVAPDLSAARSSPKSELAIADHAPASGMVRSGDLGGALLGALPGPLHTLRIGRASDLDPMLDETISNARTREMKLTRELLQAGSGAVLLDRVVDVREFFARGHVHDLETVGGWLVADGIIASNCRDRLVSRSEADLERLGLTVVSGASLTGLPDEGWNASEGLL